MRRRDGLLRVVTNESADRQLAVVDRPSAGAALVGRPPASAGV